MVVFVQEYLRKRNTSEDTVDAEVFRFKEERRKNLKEEDADIQAALVRSRANRTYPDVVDNEMEDEGSDDTAMDISEIPAARGRGRGSRGTTRRGSSTRGASGTQRGGRGGRGRAKNVVVEEPSSRKTNKSIKDVFAMSTSSRSLPSLT